MRKIASYFCLAIGYTIIIFLSVRLCYGFILLLISILESAFDNEHNTHLMSGKLLIYILAELIVNFFFIRWGNDIVKIGRNLLQEDN